MLLWRENKLGGGGGGGCGQGGGVGCRAGQAAPRNLSAMQSRAWHHIYLWYCIYISPFSLMGAGNGWNCYIPGGPGGPAQPRHTGPWRPSHDCEGPLPQSQACS